MTRTMYDAVTPSAIPTNAQMVAGYIDGAYVWKPADWARFPNAVKVRIAAFSVTNDGHVGDCEQGDMTPQSAVAWVRMRRRAGADPTVYCSEGAWAGVRQAFAAAGIPEPHWWVASYPGAGATIPAGAVAHQYADPANGSGGNYDVSVVADYWPGVDTGGDMPLTQADANLVAATLLNWYVTTPGKPKGTAGRQVFDVLGDGERIQAAVAALTGALSADEAALLAAIRAQPTGATVDVAALATNLATPLAKAIGPLLPPDMTPAQFMAAVATQLTK